MDPIAEKGLKRLREPNSAALTQLSALVVEHVSAKQLRDIIPPAWTAQQLKLSIEALSNGDQAKDWLMREWNSAIERGSAEERPLGTWAPDEATHLIRELLARPLQPSEEIVERFLDQAAVRNMLKLVLEDAIRRFTQRARKLEEGVLGGLGGKVARRGRSFGKGLLGRRASDMAENLVHSVTDVVEQAFERRIGDFLEGATQRSMKTIARELSDPKNEETMVQFRHAIFDAALQAPVSEWAHELKGVELDEIADVLQRNLRQWVSRDDFEARIAKQLNHLLNEAGDGSLHAWLEPLGLADPWTDATTTLVRDHLKTLVETKGFELWWEHLFE